MRSMEDLNPLSLKKLVLGLKCGFIRYLMLLCYFSVKLNFFCHFFFEGLFPFNCVAIVSQHLKYFASGITLSYASYCWLLFCVNT